MNIDVIASNIDYHFHDKSEADKDITRVVARNLVALVLSQIGSNMDRVNVWKERVS